MTRKRASKPNPIEIFPRANRLSCRSNPDSLPKSTSAGETETQQATTLRISNQIATMFDNMGIARPSVINEESGESWRRLAISLAVTHNYINLTVGGTNLNELTTLSDIKTSKLTTDHPDYSVALSNIQNDIYHADFFRIGLDIERDYASSKRDISEKYWKQFYRLRRFFVTRHDEKIMPFLTACRLGFRDVVYLDTVRRARLAANREFKLTKIRDSENDVLVSQLVKGWDSIIHPQSYTGVNDIRAKAAGFRSNYLAKPDVLNIKRSTPDPIINSIMRVQQAWELLDRASQSIQPRLEYTTSFIGRVAIYGYCNYITDQELAIKFSIDIKSARFWRNEGRDFLNRKKLNSASIQSMSINELNSLENFIGLLLS